MSFYIDDKLQNPHDNDIDNDNHNDDIDDEGVKMFVTKPLHVTVKKNDISLNTVHAIILNSDSIPFNDTKAQIESLPFFLFAVVVTVDVLRALFVKMY